MSHNLRIATIFQKIERNVVIRSIRGGLVSMIPVLIIGAFALILRTFPLAEYQTFLTSFAGGFLYNLFNLIYCATFGVLSVYMTFFISRSFMRQTADPDAVYSGAVAASLIAFFILAGVDLENFSIDCLGPKSMFLAILTSLGASAIYLSFFRLFQKSHQVLYSHGADREFNRMLKTLFPIAIVAVIFALFNLLIGQIFHVESFRELLINAFNGLFSHGETGFFKGFFFVLLSSILWFFGIHGSDTLEGVMQTYFVPGLEANQAAAVAGTVPHTILTKEFFDCFVLMGGCGSAICLLIAILLFSKNRARRGLGLTAAFPMIFNINELMVFGLPVIYNPVLLIPFLAVPLVCYSLAYGAIAFGLVPVITAEVAWTTPVLLGGYIATGSLAGSFLQVVNILVGVLIYLPFVRLLDRQSEEQAGHNYTLFMEYFKKNESELASVRLIDQGNVYGEFAKELCAELHHDLLSGLKLYYQPQFKYNGKCFGAEALLRWEHPVYGMLYPPLVIKLAEDGGFLPDLEEEIMKEALKERPKVLARFGPDVKLSVNVTGTTLVTDRYLQFCRQLNEQDPFEGKNICIEVTEQATLSFNEKTLTILRELKGMGLMLAIDDFAMGQTSMNYLRDNLFDEIKLDGSLVRGLFTHQNCREIISSISQLAATLNMTVLAEYVENEEQKNVLHEIGCDCYQGFLYSPAVPLE